MGGVWNVAWKRTVHTKIWSGNHKRYLKRHSDTWNDYIKIELKYGGILQTGASGKRQVSGSCEHRNESRRCVIPVVCVNELRLACSLTQLCQYKLKLN